MITKRLTLRDIVQRDSDILYELIFNDKDVVKYTFGKEKIKKSKVYEYVNEIGLKVLESNDSKDIIGLAGVLPCKYIGNDEYEFGFILAKRFWSKGYASEIGKAQISYIKNILKKDKAIALVHPKNSASIKCIEKLGLSFVQSIQSDRGERLVYSLEF